jgi:hypothetical protein
MRTDTNNNNNKENEQEKEKNGIDAIRKLCQITAPGNSYPDLVIYIK